MKRRILRRVAAKRDLIQHFAFIGERDPAAAVEFRESAERAFRLLAEMPEIGALKRFRNSKLESLRMWAIKGFPDRLVFYKVHERAIEVIRVLHAREDFRRVLGPE